MKAEIEDAQLAERIEELAERMKPRHRRFAEVRVAGATKTGAARAVGISAKGGAPWRIADRPDVIELEALLREQARRRAVVTVQGQIQRFQQLSRTAEEAGETSAAIAAEREVGRLANLYPDARITVQHELIDTREVTAEEIEALSLLRHGVRRQLAGHVIEADFVPGTVPGDHEARGREAEAGDCSSQDRREEVTDAP